MSLRPSPEAEQVFSYNYRQAAEYAGSLQMQGRMANSRVTQQYTFPSIDGFKFLITVQGEHSEVKCLNPEHILNIDRQLQKQMGNSQQVSSPNTINQQQKSYNSPQTQQQQQNYTPKQSPSQNQSMSSAEKQLKYVKSVGSPNSAFRNEQQQKY